MADSKLSALTAHTAIEAADILYIVDVSAGASYKITVQELLYMAGGNLDLGVTAAQAAGGQGVRINALGNIRMNRGGGNNTRFTIQDNGTDCLVLESGAGSPADGTVDFCDGSGTRDAKLRRAAAKILRLGTTTASDGHTLASLPLSPAQLTADQNDYNPGTARRYRLSSDAARTITGLVAGVSGEERFFTNVGSNNVVLAHQSASSAAANRFICTGGANITLAADEEALLWYDGTTARWRARKV